MALWVLAIPFFLALVAGAFMIMSRRGTLYIHNPFGYVAFTGPLKPFNEISLDQLKTLIPHVLLGDKIDHLFVSLAGDQYGGVCLYNNELEDVLEFDLAYGSKADAHRIGAFIEYMKKSGLSPSEEEDSKDLTELEFIIPRDADWIYGTFIVALNSLPGSPGDTVFAQASLIREGVGSGIHYKPDKDLLSDLL